MRERSHIRNDQGDSTGQDIGRQDYGKVDQEMLTSLASTSAPEVYSCCLILRSLGSNPSAIISGLKQYARPLFGEVVLPIHCSLNRRLCCKVLSTVQQFCYIDARSYK
jgi:hypothetical protein